jgi:hypothetical protein
MAEMLRVRRLLRLWAQFSHGHISHRPCFGKEVFKSWEVGGAVTAIMAVVAGGISDYGDCHGHDDKALLDLDETGICPRICAILN